MDTFSSVVSVNLHLQNGVTGSVFVNKKADRDVASIGTNPHLGSGTSFPLYGLPTKYDFFLFSRDHYYTLDNAWFELIDQGYAMCLVDDGTGTGNKVAKYFIDSDGNYNELYTYVLYSPDGGILETNTFTLKVTLAAPPNPAATPAVGETPNNVNPQDLVAQINKLSNLVYAVFGAILARSAAGVHSDPGGGGAGAGSADLRRAGLQRLQPERDRRRQAAGADFADLLGQHRLSHRRLDHDPAVRSEEAASWCRSTDRCRTGLDKQVTFALLQSADKSSYPAAHDDAADRHRRHLWRQRTGRADRHAVQLGVPGLGRDSAARSPAIRLPAPR